MSKISLHYLNHFYLSANERLHIAAGWETTKCNRDSAGCVAEYKVN